LGKEVSRVRGIEQEQAFRRSRMGVRAGTEVRRLARAKGGGRDRVRHQWIDGKGKRPAFFFADPGQSRRIDPFAIRRR